MTTDKDINKQKILSRMRKHPLEPNDYPGNERSSITFIIMHAIELQSRADSFDNARKLFLHSLQNMDRLLAEMMVKRLPDQNPWEYLDCFKTLKHEKDMFQAWHMIAAREGALYLYGFGHSISAIRNVLRVKCPTFIADVDFDTVTLVVQGYEKNFPNLGDLRNAMAHEGDINDNEEKLSKHIMDGQPTRRASQWGAKGRISHNIVGNTFQAMWGHQSHEYQLTLESSQFVQATCSRMIEALEIKKRVC